MTSPSETTPIASVIPGHRRASASEAWTVGAAARKRCTRSTVVGQPGLRQKGQGFLLKTVSARRWRSSTT